MYVKLMTHCVIPFHCGRYSMRKSNTVQYVFNTAFVTSLIELSLHRWSLELHGDAATVAL